MKFSVRKGMPFVLHWLEWHIMWYLSSWVLYLFVLSIHFLLGEARFLFPKKRSMDLQVLSQANLKKNS
uniref:Uncharacterized protein n=1 Tax=Cucumis melo TaxID=3656 RepID=A0A9I9EK07_CUCME